MLRVFRDKRIAHDATSAKEITCAELAVFGKVSGLCDIANTDILLVRFDLTELIGTWSGGENTRVSHRTVSRRALDPDGTAASLPDAASSSTRDKKQNGALGS